MDFPKKNNLAKENTEELESKESKNDSSEKDSVEIKTDLETEEEIDLLFDHGPETALFW